MSDEERAREVARGLSARQRAALLWLASHEDCFVKGAPWTHAGSLRWFAGDFTERALVAKHMDTSGWQPVAVWNLTDFGRLVARALKGDAP